MFVKCFTNSKSKRKNIVNVHSNKSVKTLVRV